VRRLVLRCALRAGDAQIPQEARHLVGRPVEDRWRGESLRLSAEEFERSFALGQVRTSMRLHGTNRVMLMVHSDCGAYGGLQAFNGNEEREAANHESELRGAAEFLKSNLPAIEVECYYLKFTGVWALEAS
jgi:hypothetical protein